MSKKHHWAKAGTTLHLDTKGAPTLQEEVTAVQYFSDGQTLNRAMRRHRPGICESWQSEREERRDDPIQTHSHHLNRAVLPLLCYGYSTHSPVR